MFGLTPFNRHDLITSTGKDYVDFYNLIDDFFNNDFPSTRLLKNDTFKLDVKNLDHSYIVEAEMPGYNKNEITIDYQDNCLTIKGNKEVNKNDESTNYIHKERRITSVERSILLKDVDTEKIQAKLDNGLLIIEVPKLDQAITSKTIEIQ